MSAAKESANTDLESLALRYGGRVEYSDGRVFNSGGRVAPVVRKPQLPAPAPPPAPDNTALIQKLLEMLARPQPVAAQPAPVIHVAPAQVVMPPAQPARSWNFTFVRNPDGSIKSITANPQE